MAEDITPATEPSQTAGAPRRSIWVPVLLIAVALVVATIDQISKNWVVAHLPPGEPFPVLGEALQWLFVRNPGAAFSMASGATWVFTILAAVVAGVIVWQIRRLRSVPWALFLGLLLGGVLGNLTDRLTRAPGFPEGHVIDFIYTPWMMPAIYNLADVAIVSAMCIFVLVTLLGLPITGGPRERTRKELAAAEAAASESASDVVGAPEPAADAQPTAPGEENEVRNGTA